MYPIQQQITKFCDAVYWGDRPDWASHWSLYATPNVVLILALRLTLYKVGLIECHGNFYAPDLYTVYDRGVSHINAHLLYGSGFYLCPQEDYDGSYYLESVGMLHGRYRKLREHNVLDFKGNVHPDFQTALSALCEIEE